jgi:hypothetical protein
MKSLEEEAEEYADYKNDYVPMSFGDKFNPTTKKDFIAGANSKWVQRQIIEAKLEGIQLAEDNMRGIGYRIMELEQQLKELEDESKTD